MSHRCRPRAAQERRGEAANPDVGGLGLDSWKEVVSKLQLEDEEHLAGERGRGHIRQVAGHQKSSHVAAAVVRVAAGREVLGTPSGEVLCCAEDFEFCPKAAGKPLQRVKEGVCSIVCPSEADS